MSSTLGGVEGKVREEGEGEITRAVTWAKIY